MISFNTTVLVARILKKDKLPRTDYPSYTLLIMMPAEKPGVVSTYAFKPGEPFEAYRALFTSNLNQSEVEQECLYKVTGYFQGNAVKARNDEIYYTPRMIITSMAKLGPVKLAFDPIAQIMAAGNNYQAIRDWDPNVFVMMPKDTHNE